MTFFLNPYVTVELLVGINEAAFKFSWWERPEESNAKLLPDIKPEDVEKALQVVSLTTASEPKGILVRFAVADTSTFYLPRKFAAEIVLMLKDIGDRATWWDQDYVLLPKPN